MRVAAVILAGGRGERLGGVIKANLRLGGVRLIELVRAALPGEARLLISIGHLDAGGVAPPEDATAIPDLISDYAGPLAGVAAGVRACLDMPEPPELLLTASVDTPFLPRALFAGLRTAMGTRAGAVVRCQGQLHPTIGAWRVAALAALPDQILAGTAPRSLKRLAEQQDAAILDWVAASGADPFAGINTIADLLAAQRRARLVETRAT